LSKAKDGLAEMRQKSLAVTEAVTPYLATFAGVDDNDPQQAIMEEVAHKSEREAKLIDGVLASDRYFVRGAALTLVQVIRLKGDESTPEDLAKEMKEEEERLEREEAERLAAIEARKKKAEEARLKKAALKSKAKPTPDPDRSESDDSESDRSVSDQTV
jgi:hypothetical protein